MSKSGIDLTMVQDYLKGMSYPCDKQDLLEHAEILHAPHEVLDVLQRIPEREYQSTGDVARGIGKIH